MTLTEDQIVYVVTQAAGFRDRNGTAGQDEFAEFVETLETLSVDAVDAHEDFIEDLFDAVFA